MMSNWSGETLYIGFTSNLGKRIYEHREGLGGGFTTKYNLKKLVYYEAGEDRDTMLAREKQIKR